VKILSDIEKEQLSAMRICILSPIFYIEPLTVQSLVNMVAYSWKHGLRIEEMGIVVRQLTDWARNNLARASKEQNYTHLLWIDADMVFNADMAIELSRHFVRSEIDMISALAFGRQEGNFPIGYLKIHSDKRYARSPITHYPNTLYEVDGFGMAAVLMKADVFARIPEPWFSFDNGIAEDVYFCTKAREYGIRMWIDGSCKIGHLGDPVVINEDAYKQYQSDNPERFRKMKESESV